jgi:hypothetical protein
MSNVVLPIQAGSPTRFKTTEDEEGVHTGHHIIDELPDSVANTTNQEAAIAVLTNILNAFTTLSSKTTQTQMKELLQAIESNTSINSAVSVQNAGGTVLTVSSPPGVPFINTELPIQGIIDMPLANTPYTSGRGIEVDTSSAGYLVFTYKNGSTCTRYFAEGLTRLPDAVTSWAYATDSTLYPPATAKVRALV